MIQKHCHMTCNQLRWAECSERDQWLDGGKRGSLKRQRIVRYGGHSGQPVSKAGHIGGGSVYLDLQLPLFLSGLFLYFIVDVEKTRFQLREGVKKTKLKFKMAFAIRGPTPPPLMAKFPDIFSPHFFSFAIESYIYETDFTLQKYHF